MRWYFLLIATVLLTWSPVAKATKVIRGPTNNQFTVESLPNGNYRLCSDAPPEDIQRVSGVCFRFRKQGEDIVGEYYYPYKGSKVCLTGEVKGNTITGQALEKINATAKSSSNFARGDSLENWQQDGFLQVGRAEKESSWGKSDYVHYRSAMLNLNNFYQFNSGTVLPPKNCAIAPQKTAKIPEPSKVKYQKYQNERFDYQVKYPAQILTPQQAPTNGDGQTFQSPEGQIVMQVYGRHNTLSDSLNERYQEMLQKHADSSNGKITYRKKDNNFFVVSGYRGNWVFYRKTILDNNQLKTLEFSYHRSFQPKFDSIVREVANSFVSTHSQ
ncbi:MAG: hypothetical protein ABEI32_09555 [Halothece sp.]